MASLTGAKTYPGVALERGVPYSLLNAVAAGTVGSGDEVGITPSRPTKEQPSVFAFQSSVGGTGALSAVSVQIQVSLDGTNWTTVATLANVSGEVFEYTQAKVRYIRANAVTLTAGSGAPTYTLKVLY